MSDDQTPPSGAVTAEQERARALAELAAARARVTELERQVAEIIGSSTWRVASRLESWSRRVDALGPLGRLLTLPVRVARVARREGIAGLLERVARRLPRRLGGAGAFGRFPLTLPRRLPPMRIVPMDADLGVSIVMPVFNKAGLTFKCLRSVIEETAPGSYEIIVVDNASTDETARLLAHVEGLRVIRNDVNRGFVDACNQGAQAARGRLLLFLNNDTFLFEEWLPAMVDLMGRDPCVGAVGAQLIYPDGRLQEAGGIIWSDGSGWNYGRGDDRHRPEYAYLREVDYCSGACLLVRREPFEALGGFDARYAPAYYEDTDLCFELRRLGYRVVYQPRARIVHVEGATAGTAVTSGFKRYQEINRVKFVDKQRSALARQHPPDAARVRRARDRRAGRRILVVDHMVPHYDQDSGSVRMLGLLRLLGELGHAVTFLPDNLTPTEPYTGTLQQAGVEVIFGHLSVGDYIARHLSEFDLVVLCRKTIAGKYLLDIAGTPGHPPIAFDTVDLHFLREQREAALLDDPARRREATLTKTAELALARASDQVWVVSAYEAALLRAEDPALPIAVVPNVHAIAAVPPPRDGRRDLLFIGGFRHPPNEDAVRYFVGEIFPRIRPRIPGVRFVVVGPNAPPAVRALASADVVIAGHVPDVEPLFDQARVFVAPLRYGAGMKGKIGQSLALGVPVVTTGIGAEGMELRDREHALIADAPEEFAARVVELYTDATQWTRLSEQGRRHVDALFGPAAVKAILAQALDALPAPRRPGSPVA